MRKIPVYTHPAAGWQALTASTMKLLDYQAFLRASPSVIGMNQPGYGFDCPGCAWPDHKTHKTIDVCETGLKVLASETTSSKADADFFARHTLSDLQHWSGYELEHAGRLTEPMAYDATTDRYHPISWHAAFVRIAEALKQLEPDNALFYTSGRTTNEPAFLFQLFVRCYGTNNLPDCSNMCHEPTSVMLGKQLGVGKATVVLEDFEQAKLILLFGQNPATNHPRMLEMLAHAHKQGCTILSINPMREKGLSKFRNPQKPTHMLAGQSDAMVDEVIQIQIGGDAALLTGMAKWLIEHEHIDRAFIDAQTSEFDALKAWIDQQTWADIELATGIDQAKIVEVAKLVAESRATICTWGMGITQHVQGEDNVAMITNLLLMMGMIGVDGAGACPVRGHSNVQGDRTMGIHERPKQVLLDSLERVFERPMPQDDGYDVVAGAKALINGDLDAFFSMGGNFSVAAPDSKKIQQALTRTRLNVFVATKLNQTMLYPGKQNIILPCLSRVEVHQTEQGVQFTTIEDSMCKIVPTKGTLPPISDTLKSDVAIIAELAMHVFGQQKDSAAVTIPWQQMAQDYRVIRDYIGKTIDGFENFNARIHDADRGFHLRHPARHHEWNTETNKARFVVPTYPITYTKRSIHEDADNGSEQNRADQDRNERNHNDHNHDGRGDASSAHWHLTTVRSHDQFNTMIYGYKDRYRQTTRRDVLLMHPDEMDRMGWQAGDRIIVSRRAHDNQIRTLGPLVLTRMDIASHAVAVYYPECNDLIDLHTHAPDSHTPAYKSMSVTLKRVV